ncbi:hypothetical protein O6P43_026770 [Quillaja saponaria]|uniref:Uncharacterized protein n=1 Tax=Quillaja saponaria TaxID=32244 RepID=A0AAD7L474_QUISA|nr:hypothetical protein O6P43_026770 [Quillaja saponaria]
MLITIIYLFSSFVCIRFHLFLLTVAVETIVSSPPSPTSPLKQELSKISGGFLLFWWLSSWVLPAYGSYDVCLNQESSLKGGGSKCRAEILVALF